MNKKFLALPLFFLLLTPLVFYPFIPGEKFKSLYFQICVSLLLLITAWLILLQRRVYLLSGSLFFLLGVWIVYLIGSWIRGVNYLLYPEGKIWLFYPLLLFPFFFLDTFEKEWIIRMVIIVALLVCCVSIYEKFCGLPGRWKYDFKGASHSTLPNPNALGAYISVVFPFFLYYIFSSFRFPFIFLSLLPLMALFFSQSEAAYISTFIGGLIFWRYAFPSQRKYRYLLLILLLCLIVITLKILPRYSLQWRIFHWKTAQKMFVRKPLWGWGMGKFFFLYPAYQSLLRKRFPFPPPQVMEKYAHNDYLQLLVEEGIVGFLLYLSLIATILWRLKEERGLLKASVISSFSSLLLISFVSFPAYIPSASSLPWLGMGILLSQKRRKGREINKFKPYGRALLLLLITVSFFFFNSLILRSLGGEFHYRKGLEELEGRNYSQAEKEFIISERINPYNPFLYYTWGIAFMEQGFYEEAKEKLELALKMGLNHDKVHIGLVSVYNKLGYKKRAEEEREILKRLKGE